MAETRSTFKIAPGTLAPDFHLPDAHGVLMSCASIAGEQGLLVVFACNHCPYVIHLAAALGDFAREIAAQGVNCVAINSNDLTKYPQDGPAFMEAFSAEHRWDFPYLLDESQEVAKAYDAACTPDFFLFDRDGALFYAGQFDHSRPQNGSVADGNDLREAVRRMLQGEAALADPFPSTGCNIKWKAESTPTA